MHDFIGETLGPVAQQRYKIIFGDPGAVRGRGHARPAHVRDSSARRATTPISSTGLCDIGLDFQLPFEATHDSMRALELQPRPPAHELAVNLRRAFSGIVAGNVREAGIERVEQYGPFELRGDATHHRRARPPAQGFRRAAPHALVGAERLRAVLSHGRRETAARASTIT